MYLCVCIYYEELAHAVMEAEQSPHLLSTSWRPRKARDVIQPESEGLRTEELMVHIQSEGRRR